MYSVPLPHPPHKGGGDISNSRKKGFTFIEVLVVVLLVGILARFALPQLRNGIEGFRMRSFCLEFQGFLNYLQERAVAEEEIVYLNIYDNDKKYRFGFKDAKALKNYKVPLGIRLVATQRNIFFYPDASIDQFTITLVGRGGKRMQLTTEGAFAHVKAQVK